jgi:hypothetical protein
VRRKERWNLPPAAVREAIINAVAHAVAPVDLRRPPRGREPGPPALRSHG